MKIKLNITWMFGSNKVIIYISEGKTNKDSDKALAKRSWNKDGGFRIVRHTTTGNNTPHKQLHRGENYYETF